jgi:ATP phosphoribosyltransferase regulatory subunit
MMTFSEDVLKNEEKAMMSLRALYRKYGYSQYKMSKFEEYDLYVRNKSFLASEQIITFNDLSGKLMALKPDVTLSIVKNTKDSDASLCKYFYNENVYRTSHTSREFKERMQVGLECIGSIDIYSMSEVILLAEKSLQTISSKYSLDISHMGFLSGLLNSMGLPDEGASAILRCISEKNAPEINKLCVRYGLCDDFCRRLMKLATLYGTFEDTVSELREISTCRQTDEAIEELERVCETVGNLGGGRNIRLDFSLVNDMNYYSGIIFQGFIDGIPTGILSGGRYDNLMQRFGKRSGAIGFAVYIDLLERFGETKRAYDVDVLLLYDGQTDMAVLAQTVKALTDKNESVRALKIDKAADTPDGVKYKRLITIKNGRLEELEADD